MGLLERLADTFRGRGDADLDANSARGRDRMLREREEELGQEIRDARRRLEALERETVEAHAAGEEAAAQEGRERRIRLRQELEDAEAARERVRETREELAPAVLREEAREEARAAREALEEAQQGVRELRKAADRLLRDHVVPLAAAYDRAVAGARRVHELDLEMREAHGERLDVGAPSNIDRTLKRESPDGWRAWQAMAEYHDSRQ